MTKTLYLDVIDLQSLVGDGRKITIDAKFYKKGLTLHKFRPENPKGKIITFKIPDDFPLKPKPFNTFELPDDVVYQIKNLIDTPVIVVSLEKEVTPPKPLSFNDKIYDAMVRHQIGLLKYSDSLSLKINRILNASEQNIKDRILGRLDGWTGINTLADQKKFDTALGMVLSDREKAWGQVIPLFQTSLESVGKEEGLSFLEILKTILPFVVSVGIPTVSAIRGIIKKPMMGQPISIWVNNIRNEDFRKIRDMITLGATMGETPHDIVRRVIGTTALNGSDGITQGTRNAINAITSTAVNHIAGSTRESIIANESLFDKVVFVAVLDSRTTARCRSLDGKVFNKGQAPTPPLHPRCRSKLIPFLEAQNMQRFALTVNAEQEYISEYAKERGLPSDYSTRESLPRGLKSDYDEWLSGRLKEQIGEPTTDLNYADWLRRQPDFFQDHILGKDKAKLFRDGDLSLDKFVNISGGEVTLADLAKVEVESFRKAGLDPNNYSD